MEKDELFNYFKDYDPVLPSGTQFMNRMRSRLDSVEVIKARLDSEKRLNRRAAVLSGIFGVFSGILLSAIYPAIYSCIAYIFSLSSYTKPLDMVYIQSGSWTLICILTITSAIMSLDLAKLLLKRHDVRTDSM